MHLATLFKKIVVQHPENPALTYKNKTITYAELDRLSSVLMAQLQDTHVITGRRIGLLFNDPIRFIITLLAVVKSSAIYVPFDNRDTPENILSLCKLTHIDKLLHDNTEFDATKFGDFLPQLIQVPSDYHSNTQSAITNTNLPDDIDPILYIMFTSGTTTGIPKGVLIKHSGVSRFINETALVKVNPIDSILQSSSVAFDASTFEIWSALLNGAKLVLVDNTFEYLKLGETIRKNDITILWLTTKLFETLVVSDCSIFKPLKYLIFGGETCTHKHVVAAYQQLESVKLVNGYGPTENTVFTTMHLVNDDDLERDFIPIGRPVNQTECYVLNESLAEVAEGSVGSLYVAGNGLAYSYLNKPSIDEKFILHRGLNKRIYSTGDLVKFSSEYGYKHIGRTDRQVKVRGYRVELDFIESAACSIEKINHSFAVYNSELLNHGVVLFYTTKNNQALATSFIKQHLQEKLQWYSLPSVIQFVDTITYSSSNKVDVNKLIANYKAKVNRQDKVTEHQSVDNIWMGVLQINEINPEEDFFDCGGDSLSALLLIAEINTVFGLNLKTNYLIKNSTFRAFSANLFNQNDLHSDVILMKKGINGTPVFLIPPLGGGSEMYYRLANNLDIKHDIYGFNDLLDLDQNREKHENMIDAALVSYLATTYSALISQSIQTNQVILAGHSLGGNIAIAMLDELTKAGIEVTQIHLIDAYKFGNTTHNTCNEIGFSVGFIRKTLSFLWVIVFKFEFKKAKFLIKSFYKPEINPNEVNTTPVFLYRCEGESMKMGDRESLDWNKKVKNLSIIRVNSGHLAVLKKGHVEELGEKMSARINSVLPEQTIQVENPQTLSIGRFATYLATGWFRYRQQLFTNNKSTYLGVDYPVLWLRYDLNSFKLRKSHKEIIKKNKAFTCTVTDLDYDKSKESIEALYKKYRASIDFEAEKTSYDLLYNTNNTKDIFQTKSICLYDKHKLIGIAFFDLAEHSGAQVLNFYDPDYYKNSIGKYLTLETMKYLQSIDYQYFYVGFKYAGHDKMDYKLFIGEEGVEYLDKDSNQWNSYLDYNIIPDI